MALSQFSPGQVLNAADLNEIVDHLQGASGSTDAWHFRSSAGNNYLITLADNAGAQKFSIRDSDENEVASIDSNGTLTATTFSPENIDIPTAASPSQTAEGRMVWDSDDDVLTVGDGSSRKTFGYLGSTSPTGDGAAAAGSSNEASRVDHVHPLTTVVKYKDSTQAFTSNTTFADITASSGSFEFAIAANEVWRARFALLVTFGGTGGVKLQLTGPSAPTAVNILGTRRSVIVSVGVSMLPVGTVTAFSTNIAAGNSANGLTDTYSTGSETPIFLDVLIVNGANAGTVTLQGAQNSADGTTTFTAACFMVAERVA